MTPEITLQYRLLSAARRVRWLITVQWTAKTLFWTTLACAIWMLLARLSWTAEPQTSVLTGLLTAAGLIGIIMGVTRKISPMDVARLTDSRTDLKERLSTAVELHQQRRDIPIAQAQIADAGEHIRELNFRQVFPFRFTREMIGLLILAATLTGIFFLPTMPLFWSKERKQEMEEVKRQGVALEKIAREQEKKSFDQNLSESRKAAQEMKRLAEAMRKGEMDKKEAMIQMQKLTRKMEEQQKRLASASTPEKKTLEQAAQEAKQALEQRQKQIEEAMKAKAAQEKADQKRPSEQQASQPRQKQGEQAGQGDQGNRQKLSEAMQRSQQAMKEFAQAMEKQDAGAQNQALQKLAQQMQQGQMSQQEMKQLQQQIKDMANALKGTSQDQVSRELHEIASQMESQKLDPQTMQKLAEAMKQAGQTCQSCQQGSRDAKQLQDLAKALRDGKLQLAQGEKMLPVNKPGQSEGQNPQGQPGKGYSPFGHVSNPQPEQRAGKTASRQPDTKIRGQRGKPSSDPTITYRGDPERGVKSGTPYYQVYARQRSASENPVNRENIPAAYRKQVKDYFESIKP